MWVSGVQDKEVANGGTAPRMLCLDDYFVVEVERIVTEPETGKKVKKMVITLILSFHFFESVSFSVFPITWKTPGILC